MGVLHSSTSASTMSSATHRSRDQVLRSAAASSSSTSASSAFPWDDDWRSAAAGSWFMRTAHEEGCEAHGTAQRDITPDVKHDGDADIIVELCWSFRVYKSVPARLWASSCFSSAMVLYFWPVPSTSASSASSSSLQSSGASEALLSGEGDPMSRVVYKPGSLDALSKRSVQCNTQRRVQQVVTDAHTPARSSDTCRQAPESISAR